MPGENGWERLTARSPLWPSGSAPSGGEYARGLFGEPGRDPRVARRWKCLLRQVRLRQKAAAENRISATSRAGASTGADSAGATGAAGAAAGGTGGTGGGARSADGAGAGDRRARSSWVLVPSLRESAQAWALTPLPEDVDVCLAEAEDLMFARDRITCALADRVGRVHRAGQGRQHGHASTRSWLRTAGGMSVPGAGRLLTLAVELGRLPRVRERFAAGQLAAGVVEAICTATAQLSDEQAGLAEPILLELAGKAGPAEVAKAGRYLRAVLDPDGEERDEQADYGRRFLRVRPTGGGGLEGEFYLPREAAARLRTLLDAYAKPLAEGDDRPLRVRNADAFIAFLEQKIATELLVLVNAESLPADPVTDHPDHPEDTGPSDTDPNDADITGDYAPNDTGSADDTSDAGTADTATGPGDAEAEADAGADVAADAAAESADHATTGLRDEEASGSEAGKQRASGRGSRDTASTTSTEGDDTALTESEDCAAAAGEDNAPAEDEGSAPGEGKVTGPERTDQAADFRSPGGGSARPHTAQPDPPPEDPLGHHAHAGHRPAGECRHGQDAASGRGACGRGGGARWWPGGIPGTPPGTAPGTAPGPLLGAAPGLLLATGQMLPVSGVHRLARTSALVRLVMDAEGQVLDMGRKVRLATPAQRRAVFARYATCWIDGCPLPATMCQIDHADNWSTGGLTDLKLLGPACQFHNRDRYRHPDRYIRHKTGTDRWAFTYHNPIRARRPRHESRHEPRCEPGHEPGT
ncbi:DUF222 domain-containing protein [Microbispora sp. CA-102843]|uniref:HNH endonuclease signature motif containing protein n=1 Tax=Microbispora sp. CA-102843 TaxID=3239952 RepID=UPI003D8D0D7B